MEGEAIMRLLLLSPVVISLLALACPCHANDNAGLNPLSKTSPTSFKSFADRPLFTPNRRKPEVTESDEPQTDSKQEDSFDITLLGIAVTPDGTSARIKDSSDGTLHTLNPRDIFNTWSVISITPNSLVMSKGADTKTYTLFETGEKGSPGTPTSENRSAVISKSADTVPCTGQSNPCESPDRKKQDLLDFFGSKAK